MNPSSLSISLRPRSLLETCDLAIAFVRRGRREFLTLTVLFSLLPGIGFYAVGRAFQLTWPQTWTLVAVWAVLIQGVFTLLGAELLFASEVDLRRVLARFVRQLGPYLFVLSVGRFVCALLSLTLLLAPSAFARSTLLPEVILLEGLRGGAALSRAKRLGMTFGRTLIEFGMVVPCAFVVAAVLAETLGSATVDFLLQLGSPVGDLFDDGGSLYAILGSLGVVPLLATVRLLAYVGGRAQQDGWDIQLRFQSIRARGERRE